MNGTSFVTRRVSSFRHDTLNKNKNAQRLGGEGTSICDSLQIGYPLNRGSINPDFLKLISAGKFHFELIRHRRQDFYMRFAQILQFLGICFEVI